MQYVPGVQECTDYLSKKQHYTLLDMMVTQYILNQGIVMRQAHYTEDKYHIDMGAALPAQYDTTDNESIAGSCDKASSDESK